MTNPYPPPYGQPVPPPRKKNTALWITLGIVGGLILLCGGCGLLLAGNGNDDRAEPTTTTGVAPAAPPRTTATSSGSVADLAYIAALDKNGVPYSSKSSAIELGHTVCEARQAGNTSVAVALEIAKKGYSAQQGGVIVGAALAAYCPQFN